MIHSYELNKKLLKILSENLAVRIFNISPSKTEALPPNY